MIVAEPAFQHGRTGTSSQHTPARRCSTGRVLELPKLRPGRTRWHQLSSGPCRGLAVNVRRSVRGRRPGPNAADALDGVAHDMAGPLWRRKLGVRGHVHLR